MCASVVKSFVSTSRPKRSQLSLAGQHLTLLKPHCSCNSKLIYRSFSDDPPGHSSLPRQFLEAYDNLNFDPSTHQRNDVLFDHVDGKPPLPATDSLSRLEVKLEEVKNDTILSQKEECSSASSTYSKDWFRVQEEHWRMDPADFDFPLEGVHNGLSSNLTEKNDLSKRILWSNWTEEMIQDPSKSPVLFHYDNLRYETQSKLGNNLCDTEEKRLLKSLYQYGLVLVKGTPTQTDSLPDEFIDPSLPQNANSQESAETAILHLTSLIGYHPLQTLYGSGVWSTSSKSKFYNDNESEGSSASTADSAYGSTSLPLHTDMTYMASPPGVQVFLMVQPATVSDSNSKDGETLFTPTGQSVYLDGFAAARQLQIENPKAFQLLTSTIRNYRCIDNQEGWHMEASGPVIETMHCAGNGWGPVKSIRHNDLDRLPDLPPYSLTKNSTNDEFYNDLIEAHEAWDDILRRDSMRLVIGLQPGDCVLVSNQRVMHGRYAFDASHYPRVVMGCYVGIDELLSKWRTNGFRVL